MAKNKVSLLGVGRWGKRLLPILAKHFEIAHVVHTGNPDTITWLTENAPNTPHSTDIAAVLHDPSISLIVIATPIATHYRLAKQALAAGKHVFIEKPGSETSAQLAELTDIAKANGTLLIIGYEFTYAPELTDIAQLLRTEQVTEVVCTWKKWGTFETHPALNLLVHDFSILKHLGLWPLINITYTEVCGTHAPDSITITAMAHTIPITITIDRASEHREKTITLRTATREQVIPLPDTTTLVDLEINHLAFLLEQPQLSHVDGLFATDILATLEKISYKD